MAQNGDRGMGPRGGVSPTDPAQSPTGRQPRRSAVERRLFIVQRVVPFVSTISDEPRYVPLNASHPLLEVHFGAASLNETLTPIEQCRTEAAEDPVTGRDLPLHSGEEIGIPQSTTSIRLKLWKPRKKDETALHRRRRWQRTGPSSSDSWTKIRP